LTSVRLSERILLWYKFSGSIDPHTVKVDFLKKVHRSNPPFRMKCRPVSRHRPLKVCGLYKCCWLSSISSSASPASCLSSDDWLRIRWSPLCTWLRDGVSTVYVGGRLGVSTVYVGGRLGVNYVCGWVTGRVHYVCGWSTGHPLCMWVVMFKLSITGLQNSEGVLP